ncbi:carboxylesterase family protein [uncultured Microbacterium sp.]|uniref:carboxylesterase family protein n=1 Tax=uncultured Microbacterium sp. TaxID=191216 RepID=UPI0028D23DA9|nr:carboxylesterase family protein [uncultured Microbacterium sp.]
MTALGRRAGVRVVRGIRYARAERFGPPVLDPSCSTRLAGPAPQADVLASEDCLHLTIWSVPGPPAPVLVWIHGGAHISGSAAEPVTDGARLAATQGLVVVAVQYRLGALGHLFVADGITGGTDASNAALHDQIAALRWVRAHIAGFGGDPDAVTIMGQSAGGVDVLTLLATVQGESLFHRAIAHSCTAERAMTLQEAAGVRDELARVAGVPSAEGLRAMSVDSLIGAQTRMIAERSASAAIDSLPFRPVIDHRLLHRSPLESMAAGAGFAIPLLIGSNRREALSWMGDETDETRALHDLLGAVAPRVRLRDLTGAYEGDRGRVPTVRELREAVLSEVMYRLPVERVATARGHGPTYTYVFDPWGLHDVDPGHSGELPLVFGTAVSPSAEAAVLSRRMMDAWGSFARDGRPSSQPAWRPAEQGVFHWGRDPRLLSTSDPRLRSVLAAAGARCERL